jgi:hypothetical protein
MRAHYRTANNRITFEIEGGTTKEVFEGIAGIQETFEADSTCGCCGGAAIAFRVREVAKGNKEFKFYELVCAAPGCRARFAFGQSTDMKSLFPKRKDENGNWLPNRGWAKYVAKEDAA